jgi:aminodeoxyfutalosine synthase
MAAQVKVLSGAGELRIVGAPETSREAVRVTEEVVALSGGIPVTGFVLDDLATLCDHGRETLRDLLVDLRGAGLAMMSALRADIPRAHEWLDVSGEAGIDIARLVVEQPTTDDGVSLCHQVASWGASVTHVHTFAPLARSTDTRVTTGYDDGRRVALARLLVDNIDSIQVDWGRHGPKLAQVALIFGADDVDGVASTDSLDDGPRRTPLEEIHRNIVAAALVPVQRNGCFKTRDV